MLDDAMLRKKLREKIAQGAYRLTRHAAEQQKARCIDLPDILHVLKTGFHERDKTTLTSDQIWKYAIRGKIEDLREIRIIVAIDSDVIIITVINVNK